jgi:hypothetical protein
MNDSWWLWSLETQRETMRLLILQGAKLSNDEKLQLEVAILAGPPRKMYRDDLETERWNELIEHSIWLHLAKLQEGGCVLSKATLLKFQKVSSANLNWKLAKTE